MQRTMTSELEQHAALHGGVWMPKTETHFPEHMAPSHKRHHTRKGRWTYQWHKLDRAMRIMRNAGHPFRVCVDVGAHCGLWAMHLVDFYQHVHAFEPVWLHADLFEVNVDSDNYTLHRVALGATHEMVSIQTAGEQTGSAHIMVEGRENDRRGAPGDLLTYENIEQKPLDDYGFEKVDFIKIDVEGWEGKVIEGAVDTLNRCKPWLVVEQKGNDQKGYGWPHQQAANMLKEMGWTDEKVMAGDHIMRPPS